MEKINRLLLKPAEAFEAIGVGRSRGYAMIASGELPAIRLGRSLRVPVDALHEWIAIKIAEQPKKAGEFDYPHV